jgi:hypothetical protein
LAADEPFEFGDAELILGCLRVVLKKRGQTIKDDGLPLADELRAEFVLAAQFRLASGAAQEIKDNLGFEVGGKRPTRTRHDRISLRGPVRYMLLVQRKGRTTGRWVFRFKPFFPARQFVVDSVEDN